LYSDDGLTLLLPYLFGQKKIYANTNLRVYIVTDDGEAKDMIDKEKVELIRIMALFRITCEVEPVFIDKNEVNVKTLESICEKYPIIKNDEDNRLVHRTKRYLALSNLMKLKSSEAEIIFCSLLQPRDTIDPTTWFVWMDILTEGFEQFVYIRGNTQKILTFSL